VADLPGLAVTEAQHEMDAIWDSIAIDPNHELGPPSDFEQP